MTTTEPQNGNTAPASEQAEQTYPSAEEMFPLSPDASAEEAHEVFRRRTHWDALLTESTQLKTDHDTFVEVVKVRDERETRALRHLKVAQTVLSQLSILLGVELKAEIESTNGLLSRFTSETGTYTVRLVADAVYLDLTSLKEGVKPLTIVIDENGLNEAGTLMIIGFRELTRRTPLPKRAKDQLIHSMDNAGIFGVSLRDLVTKGCGLPGCPSCGGMRRS